MLLLISLPVIGILIAVLICRRNNFYDGWIGQSVLGCFFGFCVAIACFFAVSSFAEKVKVHHSHWTLYAMHDQSSVSGSFFLGSGSVGSETYYSFYYVDKDSVGTFYKPCKIVADNAVIYEEDRSNGELEVTIEQFANPMLNYISSPRRTFYYAFHIPRGSIAPRFIL